MTKKKEPTNPDVASEDAPILGAPDDEQVVVVAEESPEDEEDEEDEEEDESLDVQALREEVKEIGIRAKELGLDPLRRFFRAYVNTAFNNVEGLLSALEGNRRKKGK